LNEALKNLRGFMLKQILRIMLELRTRRVDDLVGQVPHLGREEQFEGLHNGVRSPSPCFDAIRNLVSLKEGRQYTPGVS
jgi:hypothetical protein